MQPPECHWLITKTVSDCLDSFRLISASLSVVLSASWKTILHKNPIPIKLHSGMWHSRPSLARCDLLLRVRVLQQPPLDTFMLRHPGLTFSHPPRPITNASPSWVSLLFHFPSIWSLSTGPALVADKTLLEGQDMFHCYCLSHTLGGNLPQLASSTYLLNERIPESGQEKRTERYHGRALRLTAVANSLSSSGRDWQGFHPGLPCWHARSPSGTNIWSTLAKNNVELIWF